MNTYGVYTTAAYVWNDIITKTLESHVSIIRVHDELEGSSWVDSNTQQNIPSKFEDNAY